MSEVTIVDFGVGNVKAYLHMFERLNILASTASEPDQVLSAKRLILPGVGAFDWAMNKLQASGLRNVLDRAVLEMDKPILGVCVGMQMMAERSDEGSARGLGWISAEVVKLEVSGSKAPPMPHMGWNTINPKAQNFLLEGLDSPSFYFLHSYVVQVRDKEDMLASTFYGTDFTSAIARENIFATQFHPEKSHRWGMTLLKNFANY